MAANITSAASFVYNDDGASFQLSYDGTWSNGDILLLVMFQRDGSDLTQPAISGWTGVATNLRQISGFLRLDVYYKTADGTETTQDIAAYPGPDTHGAMIVAVSGTDGVVYLLDSADDDNTNPAPEDEYFWDNNAGTDITPIAIYGWATGDTNITSSVFQSKIEANATTGSVSSGKQGSIAVLWDAGYETAGEDGSTWEIQETIPYSIAHRIELGISFTITDFSRVPNEVDSAPIAVITSGSEIQVDSAPTAIITSGNTAEIDSAPIAIIRLAPKQVAGAFDAHLIEYGYHYTAGVANFATEDLPRQATMTISEYVLDKEAIFRRPTSTPAFLGGRWDSRPIHNQPLHKQVDEPNADDTDYVIYEYEGETTTAHGTSAHLIQPTWILPSSVVGSTTVPDPAVSDS